MLQILLLRNKCIGCNACVESAPHRWQISRTDGKSTLIGSVTKKGIQRVIVNPVESEEVEQAARNCPVGIIRIEPFRGPRH